jgi:DNA polymerase-3 subunit delta
MTGTGESGDLTALTLVTGDEPLLIDRAIARAAAAARRLDPGVERREGTGAGLTVGEFSDLVAPSLFAEPRLVVIRGVHESSKELATALTGYAQDPVDGVWLVLHHPGGARNKAIADAMGKAGATVVTCNKITRLNERIDFVRAEIRRAGGRTNPTAVTALVEAVGSDLRELASAADQLVADTGGTVDEKAVRRYHTGRAEVSGFTVSDATMSGDLAGALESLRWALGVGVAPVLIADALADGVRTVSRVSAVKGGNSYAMASELGMPPWKVDRARGMARGWTPDGLAGGMAIVAALNAAVKGVAVDPEYALERAVIDLVTARRRK